MVQLQHIAPAEIEAESFRIIEAELGERGKSELSEGEFQVLRRVIHATGDFSFRDNLRFHENAVQAGIAAIRAGKDILVDVNMAASGVNARLLAGFGGKVKCLLNEPETIALAKAHGSTRAEAAMLRAKESAEANNIGIVAVGNAPTALLKLMAMMDAGEFAPDLVVGVPVGFVNAAESKEMLSEKPYPFITALGRKGGTPVAVATVNALLRLAAQ